MDTLELIQKQYELNPKIYSELKQSIIFEQNKTVFGLGEFMKSLPLSLKFKLAQHLHKDVYENVEFFKNIHEERSFLSWVGHRLIPRLIAKKQYLYQETDEMYSVYFIKMGSVAFVLWTFENAIFHTVNNGGMVGFDDYAYHIAKEGETYDFLKTIEMKRGQFPRNFTVITTCKVEALELEMSDVVKIQTEFPSVSKMLNKMADEQLQVLIQARSNLHKKLKKAKVAPTAQDSELEDQEEESQEEDSEELPAEETPHIQKVSATDSD